MDKDCHGFIAQCAGKIFSEEYHARLQRARKEAAEDATLRQEEVPLTYAGKKYTGWMAWCEGRAPAPLILIVHNYAGLKTYDKDQAAYLARSGFAALAVDMYGYEAVPAAVRIKVSRCRLARRAHAVGAAAPRLTCIAIVRRPAPRSDGGERRPALQPRVQCDERHAARPVPHSRFALRVAREGPRPPERRGGGQGGRHRVLLRGHAHVRHCPRRD